MEAGKKYELPVVRILDAVRHIGYTLESALLDIVDNSIEANANKIDIRVETAEDSLKPQIKKIVFIDNGCGMSANKICNALMLGSPESEYSENSVSKFGFGLKSAGLSQANKITLISREDKDSSWNKSSLDWDVICEKNSYYIEENEELTEEERSIVNQLPASGTVVILDKVAKLNGENTNTAIRHLKDGCAITYHRFLERKDVVITVNDEKIDPYDPLFLSEASNSENINDYTGKVPVMLLKKQEVLVNPKSKAKIYVQAVQLPYPPLFDAEGRQKEINKRYRMKIKNIGFYIYRNDRLIAQAETLNLVIKEQQYMSFRASIDLDTNCDEDLNLDVAKTKVIFPDYAFDSLSERVKPIIYRSRQLWNDQKNQKKYCESSSEMQHQRSNSMLDNVEPVLVDDEAGDIKPMEDFLSQKSKELKEIYKENNLIALKSSSNRIIVVDELERDMLWAPGIGGENNNEVVVYLSRSHPFYKYIYKDLEDGEDTLVILDALFLNISMAEVSINAVDKTLINTFNQLRTTTSLMLGNFIEAKMHDLDD